MCRLGLPAGLQEQDRWGPQVVSLSSWGVLLCRLESPAGLQGQDMWVPQIVLSSSWGVLLCRLGSPTDLEYVRLVETSKELRTVGLLPERGVSNSMDIPREDFEGVR